MHDVRDLVEFAPLAREVAGRMLPAGELAAGKDREDHAVEFAFVAAEARERFCERYGWCTPAERRYVRKAVWNAARDARRAAQRHSSVIDDNAEIPENLDDWESRMDARDLIRRMEARLGREDLELLIRAHLDGRSGAWDPEADDCARSTFMRRVWAAKRRAIEFLRKVNPEN
jgi:hypothetical protein